MIKRFIKWCIFAPILIRIGKKYVCKNDCTKCRCYSLNQYGESNCALFAVLDEFQVDGDRP